MRYCKECGKMIEDEGDYCPHCGSVITSSKVTYRKQPGMGNSAQIIVAILVGGFFVLISLPLLFGGGTILTVVDSFTDNEGYLGVKGIQFETSTPMLVFKELDLDDINIEDIKPYRRYWIPRPGDLGDIKITIESTNNKDLFVGLIQERNLPSQIINAEYDYILNVDFESPRDEYPEISYHHHDGDSLNFTPLTFTEWEAYVSGVGEQKLNWSPQPGNYWLVVMNEDTSPDVEFEGGVGIKLPVLKPIARGLLFGGIVCMGIGLIIIYFGVIRRN